MRSTPYNFSGTTPEDTVEHTEETETAQETNVPAAQPATSNQQPVTITKMNWPLTIFLILLAVAIVYFFMKSKIPVAV